MPELTGHAGHFVATPAEILVTNKKPIVIHLEHAVTNYKVSVEAAINNDDGKAGALKAVQVLDITVPPYECQSVDRIELVDAKSHEFILPAVAGEKVLTSAEV